jgi:AAA+ superfamily predicted ATPase
MTASGYFASPAAHLESIVRRVRALLRLQVGRDRQSGRLPPRADARDRGFITADAVDAVLAPDLTRVPSDGGHLGALAQEVADISSEIERFEARTGDVGVALPFLALCDRAQLSPLARDILALAVAAELDGGVRQALGYLQNDITRQLVDLELVQTLFCPTLIARLEARAELAPEAPLLAFGLLAPPPHLHDDALSVLRMPLRPARHIVDFSLGDAGVDPVLAPFASLTPHAARVSPRDRLVLSAEVSGQIDRILEQVRNFLARGMPPLVRLTGPEGTGKTAVAAILAQAQALPRLTVDVRRLAQQPEVSPQDLWRRVAREAILQGAMLHLEHVETLSVEHQAELSRALERIPEVTCVAEGREPFQIATERAQLSLSLATPSHAERTALWRAALGRHGLPRDLAADLAGRYRVSGRTILRSIDEVLAAADAGPRTTETTLALLRDRLARAGEHRLGALATRVSVRGTWADLILPETTRKQLERLMAHFRHRTRIMVDWGFEARLASGHGISALLQGPPGTGKTLAAGLVAQAFDLELYQVDVSRIVSKWLGETEKNLATIFDEAERAHAILLFDEADSLFAKRTEVASSNDRHANLEVNFLLQRMDTFKGITLLTTNFGKSIDEAFARRMTFRIEFPEPQLAERMHLWQALMPTAMARAEVLDFELLARRFEMSGGHIRNAILKAAIEAASDGTGVTMRHLIDAGNLEYRAMGRLFREDV